MYEAIQQAGKDVPTLCYDEELKPYGACRLCSVEVIKDKKTDIVPACIYRAEEGEVVKTNSERVNKIRKTILELLLATVHNDKIRSLAEEYEAEEGRFTLDQELTNCDLCGKCVRYCREVKGENAVGFVGRGTDREIELMPEKADQCIFCRECWHLCDGGKIIDLTQKAGGV